MPDPLDISQDVSSALNRGEPAVALESCVIAHGLPSGTNVKTALGMEKNIRSKNCMPATIGVIGGKLKIGLTSEEIERLGSGNAAKLSVRDLPYAAAKNLDGGTTVSATARIALAAGIAVMATGGIGGVHRGYADTHDVSADLWELARTPIIVVCSGPKGVLDVRATAEWLETHSVPVYGWKTDELPAFYTSRTDISIAKLDSACDAAEIARLSGETMGMRCAIIVAVPPPEKESLDVSAEIAQAEHEAGEQGITGKTLTPYLLKRVGELTNGRSIEANAALLKNNAAVAAEIASALAEDSRRRVGFMV